MPHGLADVLPVASPGQPFHKLTSLPGAQGSMPSRTPLPPIPHTLARPNVGLTVGSWSREFSDSAVGLWKGFPFLGSQLEMIGLVPC